MTMDQTTMILLLLLLLRRRRRRRLIRKNNMIMKKQLQKRKIWMKPCLLREKGDFYTLYPRLRQDEKAFYDYFRMSLSAYDELSALLKKFVSRKDTPMRKSIPAEERIAITLRYLASGCSFEELHIAYRRGISTINGIVKNVCTAIWNVMRDTYMGDITEEKWKDIAKGFKVHAQFPNCLGAIGGKHIRITKPEKSGSDHNYKQFFSIFFFAMCDSDYNFTFIDIGAPQDTVPIEEIKLHLELQNVLSTIPSPEPVCSNGGELPYVIIGNETCPLSQNILRPYTGMYLTEKKHIFNYRLAHARRYLECTFAILTSKWDIFHKQMAVSADYAKDIVKACCILHNFLRDKDKLNFEDTLHIYGLEDEMTKPPEYAHSGTDLVRDQFADYFVSDEGSVSWQWHVLSQN